MAWMTLAGGALDMFGGAAKNRALSDAQDWMKESAAVNPYGVQGAGGNWNFSNGMASGAESGGADMFRQLMMSQGGNMMQGGLFNDPRFQQAFQGNDISGAMGNANQWNNNMMDPSQFSTMQQVQGMFDRGSQNFQSAGDVSGLVNQNLDAMRNLAQPFEDKMRSGFENSEFMKTRGATSGAFGRQSDLQDNLLRNDSQRVLGAQQLGQNQQQFLQNLGTQQMGMGMQGMSNNFNRSNTALQTNRQGAQSRLTNAMDLFGTGNEVMGSNFTRGMSAQGGMMNQDSNFNQMIIDLLKADNSRIGAQSGFATPMANNAAAMGSAQSDMFGGLASGFGL